MKKVLITSLAVLAAIVALFVVMTIGDSNQEEAFEKQLKEIGTEFYEEFYYEQITANKSDDEIEEFLGRFEDIGIKVDLDNLSRFDEGKYGDIADDFVNKKNDVACDVHNTRAIIYPQSPFGKEDHKVEAELDCGFETVEDSE